MRFQLLSLFFFCTISFALAQNTDSTVTKTPLSKMLRVGITEAPPYCFKTAANNWDGISIRLWRQVAETLTIQYELVELKDESNLLDAVQTQSIDVSLFTTKSARNDSLVDFVSAYDHSTLAVAIPQKTKILQMAKALFTPRFLKTVLWLAVVLLIVGVIIWFLERNSNEDDFGDRSAIKGIGSGFWWAGVTLTTIGYGDKAPKTVAGRVVAMLWMLIAIGISATLTAAVVSIMDTKSSVNFPNELRDKTVGVLENGPAISFLKQQNIDYQTYPSVLKGLEALDGKELQAFIHSTTNLRYIKKENKHLAVTVQKTDVQPHAYAFAVANKSTLREPLGRAVLQKIMSKEWRQLLKEYE